MTNGDIRSAARMDLMQHTKEILYTLLPWVLIGSFCNWLAQQFYPRWSSPQLWEVLLPGLVSLALAPLGLGTVEQLLGLERDESPRAGKTWNWFEQSARRNRAWLLGLLLFVLWLALQGVNQLGYLAMARLFGQGRQLASLVDMDQALQPRMFVLGCLAVEFAVGLVQMLGYPAVILLAAHPDWSPAGCLGRTGRMLCRRPGRCFGMAAMVSFQVTLFALVGTALSTVASLIFAFVINLLMRSVLAELLLLAVVTVIFVTVALIAMAYSLLCLIGLTRAMEQTEEP